MLKAGFWTAPRRGYAVNISSLVSLDWFAYIIASLIPYFRRLAHGTASESAILRTDARLAAACPVRARPCGALFRVCKCANVQMHQRSAPVSSANLRLRKLVLVLTTDR